MNKHGVDQLTLRDVDGMSRPDLLEHLQRFAAFFPNPLDSTTLEGLSNSDLRLLVKTARRKFQQMGY